MKYDYESVCRLLARFNYKHDFAFSVQFIPPHQDLIHPSRYITCNLNMVKGLQNASGFKVDVGIDVSLMTLIITLESSI